MHYDAASSFVTGNAEPVLIRDILDMLSKKTAKVISNLVAMKRIKLSVSALLRGHVARNGSYVLNVTQPGPPLHIRTFMQLS